MLDLSYYAIHSPLLTRPSQWSPSSIAINIGYRSLLVRHTLAAAAKQPSKDNAIETQFACLETMCGFFVIAIHKQINYFLSTHN